MQLETGEPLYQIMFARYYGASLPRFLSPDPIGGNAGDSQSWNRYAYVRNTPVCMTDPLGLYWAPGTPMPILPGDPNGCTRCIRAIPGKDVTPEEADAIEQDAWSYYQENSEKLEKYYSGFGVNPEKVKQWFTPGKGPKVRVKKNMRNPGVTVGPWIFIGLNQGGDRPGSTVAHELLHRLQFFRMRAGPNRGMDFPGDLATATRAEMTRRSAKMWAVEFWAYAVEAYVNEQ